MANIDSTFGKKRLSKAATSSEITEMLKTGKVAELNASGEVIMDTATKSLIDGATDPTILMNDPELFKQAKFYLKQIEDLRVEIEKLHAYIEDAFGTDSSNATSSGSKGTTGDTGPQGPAGAAGAKGDKGDTGSAGSAGAKGDKGDAGSNGSNGSAGAKGDKGDTGSAGAKGDKGDTGSAGSNGSNGSNGAKGDKGDTGSQGATGPAGSAALVTGVEGTQVVVVDSKLRTVTLSFENGLLKSIKK